MGGGDQPSFGNEGSVQEPESNMTQSVRRCVKPLNPKALHAYRRSLEAGPLRRTFTFARRVGRSVLFRARNLFSAEKGRVLRRNVLFPLRTRLFRVRPTALRLAGQALLSAPHAPVPF